MTEETGGPGFRLIVTTASTEWRRRAGPVVWAALTGLALSAVADPTGWFAPLGVRELARVVGLNKDTAARAIATLASAGIVTRERAVAPGGARSGYRLRLPAGIGLVRPSIPDTPVRPIGSDSSCPSPSDAVGRAGHSDDNCPGVSDADGRGIMAASCPDVSDAYVDERAGDPRPASSDTTVLSKDGAEGSVPSARRFIDASATDGGAGEDHPVREPRTAQRASADLESPEGAARAPRNEHASRQASASSKAQSGLQGELFGPDEAAGW